MESNEDSEPAGPRPPAADIQCVFNDLATALCDAPTDAAGRRIMARDVLRERLRSAGHTLSAVDWAVFLLSQQELLRPASLNEQPVKSIRAGASGAQPRTVDVPAIAATEEFWERWRAGSFAARQKEVILLVHGIRTFAGWQPMVRRVLEEIPNTKVIPIKYGYLDALRFWFPCLTRQTAIADLRRELQNARAANPDARLSVIAHSFGTYAISWILVENPDLKLHRLILSGAIIPRSYRWDYVRGRLATDVINDYGTRDIWPVLARCLSWGYGDTGRHGFGRIGVTDRGHDYAHSDFFNEKFVRDYWKPWFEHDRIVPSPWEERAPPPSWILGILSVVPLQWICCSLLLATAIGLGIYLLGTPGLPVPISNGDSGAGSPGPDAPNQELPIDKVHWRYYIKQLPVVEGANGKLAIESALRSWQEVANLRASEVMREDEATVVLELGPLPFVTVVSLDDPKGVWQIRFSRREQYDSARLEAAACHAFGRVFGLGYSDNPADVMFDYDSDPNAPRAVKPSPRDITAIEKQLSR